jgi:hypothetical protein
MGTVADSPVLQRHRLTRSDVARMLAAGVLKEDDRVELIEGELIEMAPIGSLHAGTVNILVARLRAIDPAQALLHIQQPLALSVNSLPQPDLTLVRPRADYYRDSHPGPDDVLLLIEVADASLPYDRDVKIPLYARHGIREVWLVDLVAKRLVVHRQPRPEFGEYQQITVLHDGTAGAEALPAASVDVAELMS